MKRIIFVFICLALLFQVFAAPKPSIDGRAIVADSGVLPVGPYGKSTGYLPGDSVTVTNPSAGVSIDVLILGVIDSSEGIAILLSPEAAQSLFITKDSQALVTVTKKNTLYDVPEVPPRSSANATKTDPDKDPFLAIPDEIARNFEDPAVRTAGANERVENYPPYVDSPAIASASERGSNQSAPQAIAELGDDSYVWPDSELYPYTAARETTVTEEPVPEVAPPETAYVPPEITYLPPEKTYVPPVSDEQSVLNRADESSAQGMDRIVLLKPTDPRPPVSESSSMFTVPATSAPSSAIPAWNAVANEPDSSGTTIDLGTVSFESAPSVTRVQSLERGKYYVQIATFTSSESVKNVASQYGGKYPLVQIGNDSAPQILVGPLGVDEYGAVLARFKSFGYKDAFLRLEK